MVNSVVLIGRLTRDPDMRATTTGKEVCTFTIAVDKRIKPTDGSSTADFFTIIAWERQAKYVSDYLTKGRMVSVEGRLQSRKWRDTQGQEREAVEVVATSVNGLDRPREDNRPAPQEPDYDPYADE